MFNIFFLYVIFENQYLMEILCNTVYSLHCLCISQNVVKSFFIRSIKGVQVILPSKSKKFRALREINI